MDGQRTILEGRSLCSKYVPGCSICHITQVFCSFPPRCLQYIKKSDIVYCCFCLWAELPSQSVRCIVENSFDKEEGGPLLNSQFRLQMAQHFKKTEANIITRPKGKQASLKQESPFSPCPICQSDVTNQSKLEGRQSLDASILILDDASELANNQNLRGGGKRKAVKSSNALLVRKK